MWQGDKILYPYKCHMNHSKTDWSVAAFSAPSINCYFNYLTVSFLFRLLRESEDEYSDDDDMSWKVRRSAAKCLEAIVSTRHDMLPEFYKTVSPALIARFKGKWFYKTVSPTLIARFNGKWFYKTVSPALIARFKGKWVLQDIFSRSHSKVQG